MTEGPKGGRSVGLKYPGHKFDVLLHRQDGGAGRAGDIGGRTIRRKEDSRLGHVLRPAESPEGNHCPVVQEPHRSRRDPRSRSLLEVQFDLHVG